MEYQVSNRHYNYITEHFPHSPPKRGPLSTITASNMQSWVTGIMGGANKGFSTFGTGLGSPNVRPNTLPHAVHTHYHAPITIDASHMNEDQLLALMIKVNEATFKANVVPTAQSIVTTTNEVQSSIGNTISSLTGGIL